MEKQFAVSLLGVVLDVRVRVGADAAADEVELASPELHETIAEVEAALADPLNLRAEQRDARLRPLQDVIIEEGLAVGGDDLLRRRLGHAPILDR